MEKSFHTVAIGSSAGGLPALVEFFQHIPTGINAVFIIATHLIRNHRSALKEILSRYTSLPVIRAETDIALEAGKIYLLVENTTLEVLNGMLKVSPRDSKNINTSINLLFKSVALDFNDKAIGIILSGGGDDGLKGAKKINAMGGSVMVQDPNSAEVDGMPLSIIKMDHPDAVLKPRLLAERVVRLCRDYSRVALSPVKMLR